MIAIKDTEIEKIIHFLKIGKALIIKTDTVWGLLSINQELLYEIKNRPTSKPFVRIINDPSVMHNMKSIHKQFIKKFWPGDVTIIKDNISYRMPNDNLLLLLAKNFPTTTPLFLTSANLHQGVTIRNYKEAVTTFNQWSDWCIFVIPTNESINKFSELLPSTIVDIDTWKILRVGIKQKEIIFWIYHNVITLLNDQNKKIVSTTITKEINLDDDYWSYTTQIDFFNSLDNENIKPKKNKKQSLNLFLNFKRRKENK